MSTQDTEQATESTSSNPMDALLGKSEVRVPVVGDVLEGIVVEKTSNTILVDLGILGTGVVYGIELKDGMGIASSLKLGDTVKATLIEFENEDGYIELSIRQASYEKAWEDIYEKLNGKATIGCKILDANKGGLIIEVNGITGFLPVSQLSSQNYPRVENGDKNKILEMLRKLIKKELSVRIIDADRDTEKLIVSEKAAQSEKELSVISALKIGDEVEGEVSGVVDFGAFVKFRLPGSETEGMESNLEGLVHISELAWQLIDDPREIVKTGDHVRAKIIGIDDTRISLSMKALKKDPWSEVYDKYKVGQEVRGTVDKINPFGAFVYLDRDIHGLAHISEFKSVYGGRAMEEVLEPGTEYSWRILSIEPKSHRMGLSLLKTQKSEKKSE